MDTPSLSQMTLYPIKSCAGIDINHGFVEEKGLAWDRRFILVEPNGRFITARTCPALLLIHCAITERGLQLRAPNMPALSIEIAEMDTHYATVDIWGTHVQGQRCHKNYDRWFSDYLGRPCHLRYFGAKTQRYVRDRTTQVSFADGYPLLLISEASLHHLNTRLPMPVEMARFRPNLVVSGCAPFAEDGWQRIRIGEVEFDVVKPCTRCVLTTMDPQTGKPDPQQSPLNVLQQYRRSQAGQVEFGQNLVPLNEGHLRLHDPVVVLTSKQPKKYGVEESIGDQEVAPLTTPTKSLHLLFDSWDIYIEGDNQRTILEQAEDAGVNLPFSCRGGQCGACKVRLVSGEVKQLNDAALTEIEKSEGIILACSCKPETDLVMTAI